MSVNDPLGDMLTRIRNALMRKRSVVVTPSSKLRGRVLEVLLEEGFIRGYTESTGDKGFKQFEIELKYHGGRPVISEIKRVSKPGRREYRKVRDLPLVMNGLGVAIVSTPQGVMSDATARVNNVGGEILCYVS